MRIKANLKVLHRVNPNAILCDIKSIEELKDGKTVDIEEKAAILLRGVNRAHSFASANKRTAFFTANQFVKKNKNYWILKKRDKQRDFAIKVREGRVSDKEIAEWLN